MTKEQEQLYLRYHSSNDIQERYAIAKEIINSKKENPIKSYWDNKSIESIDGEIWKPLTVRGFEKHFLISSLGRLKRLFRFVGYRNGTPKRWEERILPSHKLKQNILRFTLYVNNSLKEIISYRAVALAFIPNPKNKPTVNHIDGDRLNNHYLNLEWATWSENELHSHRVLGKKVIVKGGIEHGSCKGKVGQYTMEGELVATFDYMLKTKDFGFHPTHIGQVISGKRKSHGGFIWKSIKGN